MTWKIDYKDLRIGNVIWDFENGPVRVTGVSINGLYTTADAQCLVVENCEGVELTEEWLVKLGFVRDPDSYSPFDPTDECRRYKLVYGRNEMCVSTWYDDDDDMEYEITFEFELMGHNTIADVNTVKCVHQLQNLWYVLSGQELI